MTTRFPDRRAAGRELARLLTDFAEHDDVTVLALPRGGVPVAAEVARALGAPLDVFIVRKLGLPGHEEFAMGAIATGGVRVLNEEVLRHFDVTDDVVAAAAAQEGEELERRDRLYRDGRPAPELRGRTVIIVDDGLATGATMRAAVEAVRAFEPHAVVVAVPVASPEACDDLAAEADAIFCARTPDPFHAVGLWYDEFEQTSDDEVREILSRQRAE